MSDPSTPPRATHPADPPEVVARVKEGLQLVEILARQLRRELGPRVPLDELLSQGRETLVIAARSFDSSRGVPFRNWANLRIRGAMIDAMRAHSALPRAVYRQLRAAQAADHVHDAADEENAAAPPMTAETADAKVSEQLGAAAMAMALGMLTMRGEDALADVADEREPSPEDVVGRAELLDAVRAAIVELPDAERTLLQRHYFDDVTFEEAARELGLSKSWASRLHARAVEGLARTLRRNRSGGP